MIGCMRGGITVQDRAWCQNFTTSIVLVDIANKRPMAIVDRGRGEFGEGLDP